MRSRWQGRRALLLCLALAAAAASCTEDPAVPVFDNPFDPTDGSGDPLQTRVEFRKDRSAVRVTWNAVGFPAENYLVQRSSAATGTYVDVQEVELDQTELFDGGYRANASNFYRVRARDASGALSSQTNALVAEVMTPPRLIISSGNLTTATRICTVRAGSAVGDRLKILGDGGSLDVVSPDGVRDTTITDWDFGPVEGNGVELVLDLEVFDQGGSAGTTADTVTVLFAPEVQTSVTGNIISRVVPLTISGGGITRARFFLEGETPPDSSWVSRPDTLPALEYEIPNDSLTLAPKILVSEIESDFGFTQAVSLTLIPDALVSWSFVMDGGVPTTADRFVAVVLDGGATEMRFSEDPTFQEFSLGDTAFVAAEAAFQFRLSDAPDSDHVVYGQVRNDFAVGITRSQSIRLLSGKVAGRP